MRHSSPRHCQRHIPRFGIDRPRHVDNITINEYYNTAEPIPVLGFEQADFGESFDEYDGDDDGSLDALALLNPGQGCPGAATSRVSPGRACTGPD
ncbi:hypothetical protein [Methylocaldum marinum]|nr:hypothetical protein [Methylocaldum marinum]